LLAVAAECARKQGAFDGFKELLLQQEFEKERDVLSIEMLKGIAATAGVKDLNAFKACVENKETLEAVREDLNASEAYGFAWVPSFVIDCIYTRVGSGDLNKALCTMHPELKACG
jgi:predicted DsbA family dithiol-disulfide isomerase